MYKRGYNWRTGERYIRVNEWPALHPFSLGPHGLRKQVQVYGIDTYGHVNYEFWLVGTHSDRDTGMGGDKVISTVAARVLQR